MWLFLRLEGASFVTLKHGPSNVKGLNNNPTSMGGTAPAKRESEKWNARDNYTVNLMLCELGTLKGACKPNPGVQVMGYSAVLLAYEVGCQGQ